MRSDSKSGLNRPESAPPWHPGGKTSVSWRDLWQVALPIVLLSTAAIWLTLVVVRPAPPHTLTLSAGPKGSSFDTIAQRYRKVLAHDGITLKVIESAGSSENLARLTQPHSGVDVAFVQSGIV